MGLCYSSYNLSRHLSTQSITENGDIASENLIALNALNSVGKFSPNDLNKFVLHLYLKDLPQDIKNICTSYLGHITQIDLQYPFNSSTLYTNEKYYLLSQIRRHLNTKQIALKLIYRASRDGYSSKAF